MNNIIQGDCLEIMKTFSDNSIDLIFTDPPYGLGSKVIIRADGKPDYKTTSDFMNHWDMPTGEFWESWFIESFRLLKYGGHCVMFGIDRQLLIPKYYSLLAGFEEHQSLYWFQAQSFPKSTDLSKNLDKHFGEKREKIGEKELWGHNAGSGAGSFSKNKFEGVVGERRVEDITAPSSLLAKTYDGYKYSIAPLKQTNETILVFHKPYKTGSCLHDVLAMENGDNTITCGALNIDESRVQTTDELGRMQNNSPLPPTLGFNNNSMGGKFQEGHVQGRYPAQTFVNSETANILDNQSGNRPSGKSNNNAEVGVSGNATPLRRGTLVSRNDEGGCSKILHKCDYEDGEYDLYNYCTKVDSKERGDSKHPTMKPLSLITKLLQLFKTPNEQVVLDPFIGTGTTAIAAINNNINFIGIEKDEEHVKMSNERIKQYKKQITIFE